MGGSGGSSSTGGIGGDRGIQELNCPRKFEAFLIDVFQTGNSEYAYSLESGTELEISLAKNGGVALSHKNKVIGYLPPQYDLIADCISNGWKYSASIIEVMGDMNSPKIRVMMVGVS